MEEGHTSVSSLFCVQCWKCDLDNRVTAEPLTTTYPVFCDDSVAVAKAKIATTLDCDPAQLYLFFCRDGNVATATCLWESCVGAEHVDLDWTLASMVHNLGQNRTDTLDIEGFEKQSILCTLPNFSRNLVVLQQTSNSLSSWGSGLDDEDILHSVQQETKLKYDALTASSKVLAVKNIKETATLRCTAEFFANTDISTSYTPEYVFRKLKLNERVPFAMCRSYSYDIECPVMVFNSAAVSSVERQKKFRRYWPFTSMKCRKSKRPAGILFYVSLEEFGTTAAVEWLPKGKFTVTLEDVRIGLDQIQRNHNHNPDSGGIRQDFLPWLMNLCYQFFAVLNETVLADVRATSVNWRDYAGQMTEFSVDYNVYASVSDIRRLVDDEIFDTFFLESSVISASIRSAGDDDSAEEQGGAWFSSSTTTPAPVATSERQVTMFYAPKTMRGHENGLQEAPPVDRRILCRITRSVANGIICQVRWSLPKKTTTTTLDQTLGSGLAVLHATHVLRYMIIVTLPREFENPFSTFSWDYMDAELYHSFQKSGISRKTWTHTEKATGCKRYRKVVPINPNCPYDMERFNALKEAGPLMKYRGVCYGAILDEEKNGDVIRKLRSKVSKGQKVPAKLLFYGLPVLRSIEEEKYRTPGYEGEEFQYVPACIKYQKGKKLSEGYLSIMAPLYQRGLVDYVGPGAEEITRQLTAKFHAVTKKYAIKTQKPLGPGERGQLPTGPLTEYFQFIMPNCEVLRRGVYQPENRFNVFFHALLNATEHEDYINCTDADEKEQCVATFVTTADTTDTAKLYAAAAKKLEHNIVIFKYSYTKVSDVTVVFVGERFVEEWATIMLLQTSETFFEILEVAEESVISDTPNWLSHLYEEFYPEQHQLFKRVSQLDAISSDGGGELKLVVNACDNRLAAVQMPTGLWVPMIQTDQYDGILPREVIRTDSFVYNSNSEQEIYALLQGLHVLSTQRRDNCFETVGAYAPKTALMCPFERDVYAIRLADCRLICPLKTPVPRAKFAFIAASILTMDYERNTNFIGIPSIIDYKHQDTGLALCEPELVRQSFCRLLSSVYARATTYAEWTFLRHMDCRYRRRRIQEFFVEPVMHTDGNLPIDPRIMCAMLVAFCDYHPDPKTWILFITYVSMNGSLHRSPSLIDEHSGSSSGTTSLFLSSPKYYLDWLMHK